MIRTPVGLVGPRSALLQQSIFTRLGVPSTNCQQLLLGGLWTLTSSKVSTAFDQSGLGNDVVQGTAGNRFTTTTLGTSGRPAFQGDGAATFLRRASGLFEIAVPLTVVIVATAPTNNQFMTDTADNTMVRAVVYRKSSFACALSGHTTELFGNPGAQDIMTARVWVAIANGVSSQIWLNGVLLVTGSVADAGFSGITWGASYVNTNAYGGVWGMGGVWSGAWDATTVGNATNGLLAYFGL